MDMEYLLWLQSIRQSLGVYAEYGALILSNAIVAIAIAMPFITYWSIDKRKGQMMLAVLAGSLMINQIIKLAAAIYRPWLLDPRIIPAQCALSSATGYSFPSSHSQITATYFGSLAAGYYGKNNKKCILCILIILLAGFLRNFLGVHTPQDVIVGMLSAAVMIPVCAKVFAWLACSRKREPYFVGAALLLSVSVIIWALTKQYPLDTIDGVLAADPSEMIQDFMLSAGLSAGILLGGALEHRLICFSADCVMKEKILRVISGLTAAGIIWLLSKCISSSLASEYVSLAKGFLIAIYAVLIHPRFFAFFHQIVLKKSAA